MGRNATGSPKWDPKTKTWIARISIPGSGRVPAPLVDDKGKPMVPACLVGRPSAKCPCASCQQAKRVAQIISDRSRNEGRVPDDVREVANEWFTRYIAYCKETGQTDTTTKRSRWDKWIAERLGTKPMATITRDDIEDVRDALDAAILAWTKDGRAEDRISGKTAMNVWSCLTSAFKAAASSKRRDLRVLEGRPNPCAGVEPPGDRNSRKVRRKTFVYPKEAAQLVASEAVPIEWREVYAIAFYTYLRPGELRVLLWSDVDLEAGLIHVTKAWDYENETVKPPKTSNGVRRVPIEPELLPLLDRMREGQPDAALVVPLMSTVPENTLADIFRGHLALANVTRDELRRDTLTHVQANFRSCRDSGLTYLAMTGLGVDKISRRAGHDTIQTTMGYLKQAEDLSGDLGVPFGPLPESLIGNWPNWVPPSQDSRGSLRRARDSNPGKSRQETARANAPVIAGRSISQPGKTEARAASAIDPAIAGAASEQPTESDGSRRPESASGSGPNLARVERGIGNGEVTNRTLASLAAKARIVEALSSGDVRVLAAELSAELERLCGPGAKVVTIGGPRSRQKRDYR